MSTLTLLVLMLRFLTKAHSFIGYYSALIIHTTTHGLVLNYSQELFKYALFKGTLVVVTHCFAFFINI